MLIDKEDDQCHIDRGWPAHFPKLFSMYCLFCEADEKYWYFVFHFKCKTMLYFSVSCLYLAVFYFVFVSIKT